MEITLGQKGTLAGQSNQPNFFRIRGATHFFGEILVFFITFSTKGRQKKFYSTFNGQSKQKRNYQKNRILG